jgi:hypothetical protein
VIIGALTDIGIQVTAGVVIRNNIVINTGSYGIGAINNQVKPGKSHIAITNSDNILKSYFDNNRL